MGGGQLKTIYSPAWQLLWDEGSPSWSKDHIHPWVQASVSARDQEGSLPQENRAFWGKLNINQIKTYFIPHTPSLLHNDKNILKSVNIQKRQKCRDSQLIANVAKLGMPS